jgi:hypothetical protein
MQDDPLCVSAGQAGVSPASMSLELAGKIVVLQQQMRLAAEAAG